MMEDAYKPGMTPGQQKIYFSMMGVAFISCVLLLFNKNVIWLTTLIISAVTAFLVSRTNKSDAPEAE